MLPRPCWYPGFALAALLASVPQAALACSCSAPSFAKRYELSANVFTAVITAEQTQRISQHGTLVENRFTVTRAFKGEQPFDALISERSDVFSCGIRLNVGTEYLFFVRDDGRVGVCGGARSKESVGPEIAALDAFAAGRRAEVVEPWHFSSSDGGCTLITNFDVGQDRQGSLMFGGSRPGRVSPQYGRARVDIFPGSDGDLTLTVEGNTYGAALGRYRGAYAITGDEADEILRKTLTADTLRIRSGDREIEVSTANLADAGTDAKMLECIGPR